MIGIASPASAGRWRQLKESGRHGTASKPLCRRRPWRCSSPAPRSRRIYFPPRRPCPPRRSPWSSADGTCAATSGFRARTWTGREPGPRPGLPGERRGDPEDLRLRPHNRGGRGLPGEILPALRRHPGVPRAGELLGAGPLRSVGTTNWVAPNEYSAIKSEVVGLVNAYVDLGTWYGSPRRGRGHRRVARDDRQLPGHERGHRRPRLLRGGGQATSPGRSTPASATRSRRLSPWSSPTATSTWATARPATRSPISAATRCRTPGT
jgi:hypothetical protein